MAVTQSLTLFLIFTTFFIATTAFSTTPTTNTTATTINSTITTPYTTTTSVNSTKATKNTTTTPINSTKPIKNPTTTTVNSTKPIKNTNTTTMHSTKHAKNTTTTTTNNSTTTTNTTTTTQPTNNTIITPQKLDTLLSTLQYSGYPLFSNAISTSDVHFQLLSTPPFTLFAPKDHFLYTLDMATDADAYVAALKCHVIPSHRLTFSNLRNITATFPYLETLLPHYSVLVGKGQGGDSFVTVDGVRVSDPDLYVGSGFAVHGLDGILLTGFNMYEDSLGEIGRGFFAPANYSGRNSAVATPRKAVATAAKMGGFSRIVRKQRKLQYRRVSRKDDF